MKMNKKIKRIWVLKGKCDFIKMEFKKKCDFRKIKWILCKKGEFWKKNCDVWILEKNVNLGEKCEFGKRIWILEKNVNLGKKMWIL